MIIIDKIGLILFEAKCLEMAWSVSYSHPQGGTFVHIDTEPQRQRRTLGEASTSMCSIYIRPFQGEGTEGKHNISAAWERKTGQCTEVIQGVSLATCVSGHLLMH